MFIIHVFDEVPLAREYTAGRIATVIPSVLSNPKDFPYAGRLIVLIKGLSGVKVATCGQRTMGLPEPRLYRIFSKDPYLSSLYPRCSILSFNRNFNS